MTALAWVSRRGIEGTVSVRALAEALVVGALLAIIASRHGFGAGGAVLAGSAAVLVAFVSTVAHELGHAVVARRHGLAVVALRIESLLGGGLEREATRDPRAELRTCLAGPAVTLVLALAGGITAVLGAPYPGLLLAATNAVALIGCVFPWSRSDAARVRSALDRTRSDRRDAVAMM